MPKAKHTITFNSNGGTTNEETKIVTEGTKIGQLPVATREDYEFGGWYTEEDVEVTSDTLMGNTDITYFAHWEININSDSSMTLKQAIEKVKTDGIQVEINMTKNMQDNVTIADNQNILLNLHGNTLNTAKSGNVNVVVNNGTLEIINGSITSNASYSIIDNNSTGTLIIKDTRVVASNKQAICNQGGGSCYIEGNSYISSGSAYTIDNRKGTVTITGGTVKGIIHEAINNQGTLIIGTKDGNVNINSPIIQAGTNKNAVKNEGSTYFYDGTVKGVSQQAFNKEYNIKETESGYTLKKEQEVIDGTTYNLMNLEAINTNN